MMRLLSFFVYRTGKGSPSIFLTSLSNTFEFPSNFVLVLDLGSVRKIVNLVFLLLSKYNRKVVFGPFIFLELRRTLRFVLRFPQGETSWGKSILIGF